MMNLYLHFIYSEPVFIDNHFYQQNMLFQNKWFLIKGLFDMNIADFKFHRGIIIVGSCISELYLDIFHCIRFFSGENKLISRLCVLSLKGFTKFGSLTSVFLRHTLLY